MQGGGGGLVALRGLSAGRTSRVAAPAELLAAAAAADADADAKPIYVDVDAEGYLVPAGGRVAGAGWAGAGAGAGWAGAGAGWAGAGAGAGWAGAGAGAAAAALMARARLAPHRGARTALLEAAPGGLRLRVRQPAAPHAELLLWPDNSLLHHADVPTLKPEHEIGPEEYGCDRCGCRFLAPHALRVHLFLSCGAASALRLYAALLRRPAPSGSAFRPYTTTGASPPPEALAPAALEALATAWGRGAGGGAGHACVYCGRLYSRRYGLKIHLRTHTGYKPLRCPHCRRAFGDPSNLNKHVKLHGGGGGGTGTHECAACGKLLVRRRDLERHVRARHAAHVHVHAPAPTAADRDEDDEAAPPPPSDYSASLTDTKRLLTTKPK